MLLLYFEIILIFFLYILNVEAKEIIYFNNDMNFSMYRQCIVVCIFIFFVFVGYGKFQMVDGSYYEGIFFNGEIDGKGMRFFLQIGSKYIGQFVKGELYGRGIMVYIDGLMYEGEWYRNRKYGESQKNGIRNE